MSQQVKQRFQRSVKSSSKQNINQYTQSSITKNNITTNQFSNIQTSPKKSQLSIDQTYQFVMKSKQQYQNKQFINNLVNKLKKLLLKKQLKCFYKIKLFKLHKQKLSYTIPYLSTIEKSIENRKKYHFLMLLKFNSIHYQLIKNTIKNIHTLYKKKNKQNITYVFNKIKSNKIQKKMDDFNQMKQKIQLSLSKNEHSVKSLQSISEIVNAKDSKKLLSPRSMQKQLQFDKFAQSIQSNITKQKDYQLGRINIQNLLKKFRLQDKFKDRLGVYEMLVEIIGQSQKNSILLKQSTNILYKINSFMDPLNNIVSIANMKQIRKQLNMIRNKLQPTNNTKKSQSNTSTPKDQSNNKKQLTYFDNIQKTTDLINSLFQQISIKNIQKNKLEQQLQTKIILLTKQQIQLKKKINLYQDNQSICQNIINKFIDIDSLTKQINESNRKNNKRKNQFPFTFLMKINQFLLQQRKNTNQINLALKNINNLYNRKNLSQQIFEEQKNKINQKYLNNQLYSTIQPQINQLITTVIEKQRQLNEAQLKKLKIQNDKISKTLQSQKSKLSSLNQSLASSTNGQKQLQNYCLSTKNSTNINKQNIEQLKQTNDYLTKSIKVSQSKVKQLQTSIKDYEKSNLQNDLVKQTLSNILQKIENHNETWMKDIDVLKNGRNKNKYELIFRIQSIIKPTLQQQKQFSDSFETLIYNSKKDQQLPKTNYPNQINKLNQKQRFQPSFGIMQQIPRISQGPRYSQRISWDLSAQTPQINPKLTNSFMLQDNLLDQSELQFMRQSNLLGSQTDCDNNNKVKGLFQDNNQNNKICNNINNHNNNNIINLEQINIMNSVIVKIMSNQFYNKKIIQQQLIKLNNPYLVNLVILLQSYLIQHNKVIQLTKQKQQTQQLLIYRQSYIINERKIKQFINSCLYDIDYYNNINNNNLKNNPIQNNHNQVINNNHIIQFTSQSYWNHQLNTIHQPSIIILQLTNLLKKLSSYIKQQANKTNQLAINKQSHNLLLQQQFHKINQSKIQQLNLSKVQQLNDNLIQKQRQLLHQGQTLISLQRQMKQNQMKYQQQLSYYQRLQQQSVRSPTKQPIQRSIRSSKSLKSLKSVQSSESRSVSKYDEIKNHYKQSIQQMSKQQAKLLQQLQNINIEKNNYICTINIQNNKIKKLQEKIIQLETQIINKENNQNQIKLKYQADFDSLRQDLQIVKLEVVQQVQRKQNQIDYYKQAYDVLAQRYKQVTGNNQIPSSNQLLPPFNDFHQQQLHQKITHQLQQQFQQRIFKLQQLITTLQRDKQILEEQLKIKFSQIQKLNKQQQINQITYKQQIQKLIQQNKLLKSLIQSLQNQHKKLILQIQQKTQKLYKSQKLLQQRLDINQKKQNLQLQTNQDFFVYNSKPQLPLFMHNNDTDIQHVDENNYVVTTHGFSSDENIRQISQVEQLKMQIKQMQQERNHVIQSQILKALKIQQQEFNNFYKQNIMRVQQHFNKQVIPSRVRQAQNQFYKHHLSNSGAQITVSSAPLVHVDYQNMPVDFNQQAYLSHKYQQWKLTYLPVILELKQKQWIQRYESTQLQKILTKKYEQWQNIRLLSIIKQKKNEWILEQLFKQRTIEWNKRQQQNIKIKIHQVEQYWQKVVLARRINQQINIWKSSQQQLIKHKIKQVQEYWQKTILPLKIKQYQQTHSHSLNSSQSTIITTYTAADLDRILAEQHNQWRIQFQNQIQLRLHAYQQQWQTKIIPQLKLNWQRQYSVQHISNNNVDISHIDQIISAKYQQWKHTYLPQYLKLQRVKWLEQFMTHDFQLAINKKQQQWQTIRLLAIVRQPRNSWVIDAILKDKYQEWQNTILLVERRKWQISLQEKRKQWQLSLQQQKRLWQTTILLQKRRQWQKQYVLLHPQKQAQVVIKQVVKQVNINDQIKKRELIWIQSYEIQVKKRIEQVEHYWQGVLSQQRVGFEKTIENALLVRTGQIQTYWQTVMIPQIKGQWQKSNELKSVKISQQQQQQRVNMMLNERLSVLVQMRLQQKQRQFNNRLNEINIDLKRQMQIQINKISTEFSMHIDELKRQLQIKNKQYNELNMRYVQLQIRNIQLQRVRIQLLNRIQLINKQQIQNKNKQLLQNKQNVNKNKQSIDNKQFLYRIQTQHMKQINDLRIDYEQKLSQVNHDKLLLSMQIKQLQINFHNNKSKPKQINITTIQSNYQKQILSLQSTIKTKQSQVNFLKKSIDSLNIDNQQLNNRIIIINNKLSNIQLILDQTKNINIKYQYQIKYMKQKQNSFNKKIQSKDIQYNQIKSKFQFQKNILEKKIKQLTNNTQLISSLQLKLTELESQLSLKHSNIKNIENQLDKKKRQLEQEKLRTLSHNRDIQLYKSTIKQHQSIIQDLRLEIRKTCDQINRQKLIIQTTQQKQKSYIEQLKKYQAKTKDRNQFEDFIRQNQRLKLQISRLRQKLLYIESNQSREIYQLKQTIHTLQTKLQSSTLHYRQGDATQIQILKRINYQISDLVSTNKQLQMRIIVLENEKELSAFGISIERFFVAFQQQMDNLVNYLISNQIWTTDSINSYNKFQQKSRQALSHGYVEDYFRQWQAFMRGLIQNNYQQTIKAIKINGDSKSSLKEEDVDDIVQKYDAVLNDVKFTLTEYLKTGDQEYLSLMSKSLGLQIQTTHQYTNGQVVTEQRNGNHQERTLSRQ